MNGQRTFRFPPFYGSLSLTEIIGNLFPRVETRVRGAILKSLLAMQRV
jgi:hypothetical protein